MRIILVRHGRSAHAPPGWLDRPGLDAWLVAYDAAGLASGEAAPAPLRALAAEAGIVVASDLPRAIESAALLAPGAVARHSPLLREASLPIPALGRVRLPVAAWGTLVALHWLRDRRRQAAAASAFLPARTRGREAAAWLAALAHAHGSVLAVTHGVFRRYLADALEAEGWKCVPGRRQFRHWSAWELARDAEGQ